MADIDGTTVTTEQSSPALVAHPIICQICGQVMDPTGVDWIWQHPRGSTCAAQLVDERGEALDAYYYVGSDGMIYEVPQEPEVVPPVPPEEVVTEQDDVVIDEDALPDLPMVPEPQKRKKRQASEQLISLLPDPTITTMDVGLNLVFEKYGVERLGGASGDSGWSAFSTYQKCPYLFKVMYLDGQREARIPARALEIGSGIHALLAVDAQRMIDPEYPISSSVLHEGLLEMGCDSERVMEIWRIYQGYQLHYENDYLIPLAVELHVVDEKTRESCRYDLVAKVIEPIGGIPAGTYIVEHKSASRFDDATLDGWRNDGEIIGQMMLWQRKHLTKKFGKLAGVMINLIGKQKMQRFERVIITPEQWQMKQHTKDLRQWQALRQLAMAAKFHPRARANCLHRYGKCALWDHCAEKSR